MPPVPFGDSVYVPERVRRELVADVEHVRRRRRNPVSRAGSNVGGPAPDLGPADFARSNPPT